jgi:EAL and modified HD-GYP domain-containing signal transduction protein
MLDPQGVGSIIKNKYCLNSNEPCARYLVATTVGSDHIPDSLYPNMHDVAEKIIEEARKSDPRAGEDSTNSSFIARQPIFDRKMGIYGYELLYRQGKDNFFLQQDDNKATTELIYDSFLVFGLYGLTDGAKAFINFSKELIESNIPSLLPKKDIVVEVLERGQTTQATVEACKRIRDQGYSLALDDFVFDPGNLPLLQYADIVKVDFPATSAEKQSALIKRYKGNIQFLAKKVETREDYNRALSLGYDYFQGFFFCKPTILNSRDIASININLFNILKELNTIDPSFSHIASIIQGDLGLSLKLLKLANSAYFGARSEVKSILHALSFIGTKELYQWVALMMLKDYTNIENAELIRMSLIRAKFMELLAQELQTEKNLNDYYFTGMFSFIDVLLNQGMDKVLAALPLSASVKDALLGKVNDQGELLRCVVAYETASLDELDAHPIAEAIGSKKFMSLYIDAIKWVKSLNY